MLNFIALLKYFERFISPPKSIY
ncbi:hypothetical protein THICB3560285 [Thiomonas sp. CB3]|nr:hypothetical protein THICB3560285 [Thiomonas sp. CB3]